MTVENVTENRSYQLPHPTNETEVDCGRLIAALGAIDVDVAGILVALATKAGADHGHVIADITGLAAALTARQEVNEKGQANGYASLGADGKIPSTQLPAALFGAMAYQGTWNANTNTPTIPAASAVNKGWYFKVSTAGNTNVDGESDWKVGDWIVSNGTSWDKIDNTDQVSSVAGLVGVITAAALKTALGLKAAAYLDVGTAAGTVAAGDDSRIIGALQRSGGTMTGPITLAADPTSPLHAATKQYVDGLQGRAKAWVNFNGTGTVAIRDSYNVSSITDNGAGDYTINFASPMANANYATLLTPVSFDANQLAVGAAVLGTLAGGATAKTTTSVRVITAYYYTSGKQDMADISAAVFGA